MGLASMVDAARGKDQRRSLAQWLTHIESVHFRSIDLTLDRFEAVFRKMLPGGLDYKAISVAGTNGKGSAVEMLTAIFSQTGFHVGTYTSPHLVSYAERIQVDRQPVSEHELCWAFETIEGARRDVPLTYFEFGTLAALLIFQQRGVQIAILEVGMGGRLDAVNAVDSSAALVTSVGLDHQLWLGSNRETIAAEKAGIFRGDCPAVCSDPDTPTAIIEHAAQIGAELYRIGEHFSYRHHGAGWDWIGPENSFYRLPRPPLTGEFQLQNAAGALMVAMAVKQLIQVTEQQLRKGLSSVRLRGRFEVIQGNPLIILDVAHNIAAILELKNNLATRPVAGRTLAVCGMLEDKPIAQIVRELVPSVDTWYVGTIADSRGCSAEELAKFIEAETKNHVYTYTSVLAAFNAAREQSQPDDRILVFGSFHTVGDIIRALEINSIEH